MNHDQPLENFTDKWLARWPEWRVAEVFVPRHQRERTLAWFALRQELTDAAWGGSDPQPGTAKLAWWAEELEGWTQGRRRHPLGAVLQRHPVPWSMLVSCLPALRASRDRAADAAEAIDLLEPFAEGVSGVAAILYDSPTPAPARSVVVGLLAQRLLTHGAEAVPQHLRNGVGGEAPHETAVAQAWARELLRGWPTPHDGSRPGRIQAALMRARLQALAAHGSSAMAMPSWRVLLSSWRAARG